MRSIGKYLLLGSVAVALLAGAVVLIQAGVLSVGGKEVHVVTWLGYALWAIAVGGVWLSLQAMKGKQGGQLERLTRIIDHLDGENQDAQFALMEWGRAEDSWGRLAAGVQRMVARMQQSLTHIASTNTQLDEQIKQRSRALDSKNQELNAILDSMDQLVITVDGAGRISRLYTPTISLPLDLGVGGSIEEILFQHCHENLRDTIMQSIDATVGSQPMVFELNKHNFPLEVTVDEEQTVLELSWSPIVENRAIAHLLLTIRDVTHIRHWQHQSESQGRQLQLLDDILRQSVAEFESLMTEVTKTGTELEHSREPLRDLHTLKGLARIRNFSVLQNTVHDLEQQLIDSSLEERTTLLEQITAGLEEVVVQYQEVYGEVSRLHPETAPMEVRLREAFGSLSTACEWRQLTLELLGCSLADLFGVLEQDIGRLAADYQREVRLQVLEPAEYSEDQGGHLLGFSLEPGSCEAFLGVMGHLLANSVAHAFKPAQEPLEVEVFLSYTDGQQVELRLKDDGLGLDIQRVEDYLRPKQRPLPESGEEWLALLCERGFSTRSEVTTTSGRGVGMAAVQETLREAGGGLELHCGEPDRSQVPARLPLTFKISLPSQWLVKSSE